MIGEVDLWRRLAEAIAAEQERRADGILSGVVETYDRYRFECGFLQGLQWVVTEAERIVRESHAKNETDVEEE